MTVYYAFVGSWGLREGPKGLGIYTYDPESGKLEYLKTVHEEMAVGCQALDAQRGILYITDETGVARGGALSGYVQAFSLGREEVLTDLNGQATPLPKPSYLCVDKSGRYALVAQHGDMGKVTKLVRREDGRFAAETVTDDAGLVLLAVEPDGRLGRVLDVVVTPGEEPLGPHGLSHQHCVAADPSGELFLVTDKGTERIYSFRLDRENGKLKLIHTTQVENGFVPRFVAFHPTLPIVYENNEHQPVISSYRYDVASGALEELGRCRTCDEDREDFLGLGLVISPDGSTLYTSLRGTNTIVVLNIDEAGQLHRRQTISSGGENPRGLCLAPDGRFLLCANTKSGTLTRFAVAEDGTLTPVGEPVSATMPTTITIAKVE